MAAVSKTTVRRLLPIHTKEQQAAADAIGKGIKACGYEVVKVEGELPPDVDYLWLSEVCEGLGLPMRPEYEGAYITVRKL